jgi:hypothetical protein
MPNRLDQNRTSPCHIIKRSTENRERILKAVREKKQIAYKGKLIKITADFPMETLKARSVWSEVFWALNENNFNPRITLPSVGNPQDPQSLLEKSRVTVAYVQLP